MSSTYTDLHRGDRIPPKSELVKGVFQPAAMTEKLVV